MIKKNESWITKSNIASLLLLAVDLNKIKCSISVFIEVRHKKAITTGFWITKEIAKRNITIVDNNIWLRVVS